MKREHPLRSDYLFDLHSPMVHMIESELECRMFIFHKSVNQVKSIQVRGEEHNLFFSLNTSGRDRRRATQQHGHRFGSMWNDFRAQP